MSMEYIRNYYKVPARQGGRVCYSGGPEARLGTIVSASGGHLNIRLDGQRHTLPYHPTWKLEYLPDQDARDFLSNISTGRPVESGPLWAGYDPTQTGGSDGGPIDPASAGGEA